MPDIRLQALPPCQLYRTRLDLGGESIYELLGMAPVTCGRVQGRVLLRIAQGPDTASDALHAASTETSLVPNRSKDQHLAQSTAQLGRL